jgi:hypothetical protein
MITQLTLSLLNLVSSPNPLHKNRFENLLPWHLLLRQGFLKEGSNTTVSTETLMRQPGSVAFTICLEIRIYKAP